MAEFYSNFSLMSAMIVKVLLGTGLGPAILLACIAKSLARFAERRSKRALGKVIEFPTWGERTVPGKITSACIGTGARPANYGGRSVSHGSIRT